METVQFIKKVREDIVKYGFNSGKPTHYGGSLSMSDYLGVLYNEFIKQPLDLTKTCLRDYFILSKGHAALGLYSVLFNKGYFGEDEFKSYLVNGSNLIAHPVMDLSKGIESSNGSLGQGISMACGIAHGLKLKGHQDFKVFTVIGDGESNEGIVYEAANYAANYELSNLCVFLDLNGFQNDGSTKEIMNIHEKYFNIFKSIGWEVHMIDGHDLNEIRDSLNQFYKSNKPFMIIGKTVKGKGFPLMENNNDWHHNLITNKILENLNINGI